jgi:hypothetical protein
LFYHVFMRGSIASCVAFAILALASGIPLLNCPFLTPKANAKSSCHREAPGQHGKCPLSLTLETCPYFITDGKLGIVEAKAFAVAPALPVVVAPAEVLSNAAPAAPLPDFIPSQTDLHIRIRVLLI